MYQRTFHSALTYARELSHLSLNQLEALTGLTSARLSRLERAVVLPTPKERQILATALNTHRYDILQAPARPPRLYQKLKCRGLRHLPPQKPFYPPSDRPSRMRLSTANRRYPKEMNALERLIGQHDNFPELNCLSEKLALDSSLECLFLSALFAQGAKPAMLSPYSLPPRLHLPIICPQKKHDVGFRPFPCLELHDTIYILQVAFPGVHIVDYLCHRNGQWSALEIDGPGHDSSRDKEKERALQIPFKRLNEQQVKQYVWQVIKGLKPPNPTHKPK